MLQQQRTWHLSTAALTLAAGLLFTSQWAMAGHVGKVDLTTTKRILVKVTGENICLGCALKKEKGAKAQCSVFGHKHVLRVTKALAAGHSLPIKGWVLHYLETDKSQTLIKKRHGERITIAGVLYPTERVLEVTAPKPASKKPEHPKRRSSEHPEHPR